MVTQKQLLEKIPSGLLINGKWIDKKETFKVENPATGKTLANIVEADPKDGKKALDAAVKAQKEWAATAPRVRGEILRKAFEIVTERAEEFALLMTLEMGKPLNEARGEVTYGSEFLRWFSEEAVRVTGRYGDTPEGNNKILVQKKPVGPSLLITPWNFPLAMATRKVAPAVAAGCTMVLKPAELTPLTSILFAEVMQEAGLPPGVLNIVSTTKAADVTGPIIADSRLRKLSFTGSTGVGRTLLAQASQNVLRTSMELGGNAPFLVFDDADLDKAVDGAMLAKMRNMGEACTAANRILVQEGIAEEFTKKLAQKMKKLKPGIGTDSAYNVGPLIDQKNIDKVSSLVDNAKDKGGKVLVGGSKMEGAGYFFEPTVLADVPHDADILREEIFGPVIPVVTFKTEDEAISLANATEYGLIAYAFTENINRGLRLPDRLEVGMLGLNTGVISNAAAPFGGVKQSGLGREGSFEGIDEYLYTQYVGISSPYSR